MTIADYKKLLKKTIEELPESVSERSRFEIPKVKGHIQGNNTIITNFKQIAKFLGRDENHFLKFILKETAAPGKFSRDILIIGRKVSAELINEKIHKYVDKYGLLGVSIFIGIPLPGSGVYSGALGAYLLGINFKKFLIASIIGVLIAGILVTIISLTGVEMFELFIKRI